MLRSVLHRDQQGVAGAAQFRKRGHNIEFVVFGGGEKGIDYFEGDGDVDVLLISLLVILFVVVDAAHMHNQVAVRFGDPDVLIFLLHRYKFVVRRGANGVEQTLHVNAVQVGAADGHVAVVQLPLIYGWQDFFSDGKRQVHVDALAFVGVFNLHMQIALRRWRSEYARGHSAHGFHQQTHRSRQLSCFSHFWEASDALPAPRYGGLVGKVP